MKLIFNSLLAVPFNSEMKQYKTISKCLGVILTRIAISLTPDFALRLLSSDYTEITGYEFVKNNHTNYLITNEGALSEIMENLMKKKQAILNSPYVGAVARFLLNSLPVRMTYLDFILELNPEYSNSYEFKDKFKKAIGTESNMDKLFSIRENYPKLSLSVDTQMVALILSEKVDLEDETELIRIQELIDQSEIKKEDKLKVLLSTMQLTDNEKTVKFFITIANL
ncbi:predicted protein [Naegleria gruberi]|uniref:Predicted protein n=1 Tax=Naegleria gruberi TaxID=5762 RepID=D2VJ33_NAEGR|nr:uncharacterized protein NAEGRDRAFT_68891 [Naegleria gruberi]EFC43207.1 predicted protein [Naegleria gruberi]|eukprot:XP_002675951.1 predicted protein [Naegleria gruberi strain NEG-M]